MVRKFFSLVSEASWGIKKYEKNIFFVVRQHWSEIDSYLPILYRIKKCYPEYSIITIVLSLSWESEREEQSFFYEKLKEVTDLLIYPKTNKDKKIEMETQFKPDVRTGIRGEPVWHKIYLKYVRDIIFQSVYIVLLMRIFLKNGIFSAEWLLKDHTEKDNYILKYLQRFFGMKCFLYPHGTMIYQRKDQEIKRWSETDVKITRFFTGFIEDVPYWEKCIPKGKIEVTGHPRYDRWWIDKIISSSSFQSGDERRKCLPQMKVVAFFVPAPSGEKWMPQEVFDYLMRSAAEVLLEEFENVFVLIKPHPRQSLQSIEQYFSKYPKDRWAISTLQCMQVAHLANIVISGWSSVLLDAIALDKPTIEFFKYEVENDYYLSCEGGQRGSAFRLHKIVIPADTKKELAQILKRYFENSNEELFLETRQRAKRFLYRFDKDSTTIFIDKMMECNEEKRCMI